MKEKERKIIFTESGLPHTYLQLEVFVGELGAVDRLSSGTVVVGEVSSLAHEVGDDTVELAVLVPESLLSGAERTEVLGRLGHNVGAELHDNATSGAASNGHVEEHLGESHCFDKKISSFF